MKKISLVAVLFLSVCVLAACNNDSEPTLETVVAVTETIEEIEPNEVPETTTTLELTEAAEAIDEEITIIEFVNSQITAIREIPEGLVGAVFFPIVADMLILQIEGRVTTSDNSQMEIAFLEHLVLIHSVIKDGELLTLNESELEEIKKAWINNVGLVLEVFEPQGEVTESTGDDSDIRSVISALAENSIYEAWEKAVNELSFYEFTFKGDLMGGVRIRHSYLIDEFTKYRFLEFCQELIYIMQDTWLPSFSIVLFTPRNEMDIANDNVFMSYFISIDRESLLGVDFINLELYDFLDLANEENLTYFDLERTNHQ